MKKVIKDDYGIRPAGQLNRCFYCNQKVGDYHKDDCVVIGKNVKLSFNIEIDSYSPYIDKNVLMSNLIVSVERLIDLLKNSNEIEITDIDVKEINTKDTTRFND